MKTVGIIGNGKIGRSVASLLRAEQFTVVVADSIDTGDCVKIDATDKKQLTNFARDKDALVSCGPYFVNKTIAEVCAELNIAYFDPTEDTEVAEFVSKQTNTQTMMTQCGLAPGAINIIASNLIRQFDTAHKVKMRVGALPKYTSNAMGYYLTWSTSGLINEYVNDCDIISGGKHVKAQPLDGLERIMIDGNKYEAFNTSGGAASMCETFADKVQTLSYKTIRYPGHHSSMKFLLDDLNLKHNKEKFIDLFDQEVPYTTEDVIVIMASVNGMSKGKLVEKTYHKKIYGNKGLSAIQLSTASGMCANIMLWALNELPAGYVKQEDIPYDKWINTKFGKVYE
tara:strand:+ start:14848 stop:15867 length:1020 start_codon:yes stop_codon:yes gene_type:complete